MKGKRSKMLRRFLRDCDREKALLVLAAFQSHYSPFTCRITTKAAKEKKNYPQEKGMIPHNVKTPYRLNMPL